MLAAWYHPIFATVFGMVCFLLIVVVLLQRGRGVGLSGAFGGTGTHAALGSKTGDVLTWITMVGIGIFILLSIGLNYVFREPAIEPAPAPAEPAPGEGETGAMRVLDDGRVLVTVVCIPDAT